jgi:hypothetical protein
MVIFDLICLNGHQFEGWFEDLADLEYRLQDGQLTCPVCGMGRVSRRPSTFGMVKKRSEPARRPGQADRGEDNAQKLEPKALASLKKLVELTETLEKDFVDVGLGFAAEALKIRYGVSPPRNIRGHSTADEEEILRNEGVEYFKLPMLSRKNIAS